MESSKKGLSGFLADHEDCGGGFDIQRRDGTAGSIVRVICGGCGQAIEYPAGVDEEIPIEPAFGRISRSARRPQGVPAARRPRPRRDDPLVLTETQSRASRVPGWASAPLLLALVAVGALLVVLGVSRNGGSSDSTLNVPAQTTSSVPLTTASVPLNTGPPVKLDRRRLAERVSIGIPAGWNAGVEGPAVAVAALNGRAEVQVYFEHGARPADQLMREARAFLLQRHTEGSVAEIGPTEIGGREVRRVRVVYPGGTETATVLVAGGYSYLILERLSKPFSVALRRTTDAVAASFRPI